MNYLKIDKCDYLNGKGVGVVLWLSGCNHRCNGCQNQKSWSVSAGQSFDERAEDELLEYLKLPYISRLTLSGGDPLHENNLQDVLNLVNKIHLSLPGKTIWLYSGYTWNEIWTPQSRIDVEGNIITGYTIEHSLRQDILKKCDVFIDGRYVDNQRDITLKWAGSQNQKVIDVKRSMRENRIILYEI